MSEGIPWQINGSGIEDLKIPEKVWIAGILASTIAVLLISVYCLSNGITTIFMHLYYFPLILITYHYRSRGFSLAALLSASYLGLVYYFQAGQLDVVIGAWARFFVFIGIAGVIAFFSERLAEGRSELAELSHRYHNLFENMMEGFAYCRMIYDAEGRPADWLYLNVNPAFEQLTGLKDIIGKRVLEAIPDIRKLTPELFDTYGRVASTGTPETFEIDFTPLNMWLRVSVFSPEKGYFVAVFEDITQRKKTEESLLQSEKRYRDLFEINNAVMLIIDQGTGKIIGANTAASRFYGYSREELTGMPITQINTADPDQIQEDMSHAAASQGMIFQFSHRKKNGEIRDVQVFSSPIVLGDQHLLHSIVQDITDQKRAENALQQTNKKLNLLSGITRHDIINQIFTLKGYLALSKKSLGNPEQLSEYISKEERVAATIERQIAFTKEYQDLGVKEPVWQSIETCMKNAVLSLPLRDIRVNILTADLEVYADPLLEKVFYNLTDNALRYGGPSMKTIKVSVHESEESIVIRFEDDGAGISSDDKKRLFERGFGRNTGLGLFLSREILAITGSTITETGESGTGARFEITVPAGMWRMAAEK